MREHKYQVWHKQEQKMHSPLCVYFLPDGRLFGVVVEEGQLLSIDDFELREYTGFKDKNGQEVYEGDIIRAEEEGLGVIKYGVGCFYYEDDWNGRIALEELTDLLVVVGNIYEHPHLLPQGDFEHKTNQQ